MKYKNKNIQMLKKRLAKGKPLSIDQIVKDNTMDKTKSVERSANNRIGRIVNRQNAQEKIEKKIDDKIDNPVEDKSKVKKGIMYNGKLMSKADLILLSRKDKNAAKALANALKAGV